MINIGILGLASFYSPAYAERVMQRPDTSIIAASTAGISDEDVTALGRPTVDETAEQFVYPAYDTVESVLSQGDAVVVARAPNRSPPMRYKLWNADGHVEPEPTASDADGARRDARAAAETEITVILTILARYVDRSLRYQVYQLSLPKPSVTEDN